MLKNEIIDIIERKKIYDGFIAKDDMEYTQFIDYLKPLCEKDEKFFLVVKRMKHIHRKKTIKRYAYVVIKYFIIVMFMCTFILSVKELFG